MRSSSHQGVGSNDAPEVRATHIDPEEQENVMLPPLASQYPQRDASPVIALYAVGDTKSETDLATTQPLCLPRAMARMSPGSSIVAGEPCVLSSTSTASRDVRLLHRTEMTIHRQAQQIAEVASAFAKRCSAASDTPPNGEPPCQRLREEMMRLTTDRDQMMIAYQTVRAAQGEVVRFNQTLTERNAALHATNVALANDVQHLTALHEEQRQASAATAVELTAILRGISDAVLVVTQAGETQWTNAAYDTLFGDERLDEGSADEDGQPLSFAALPCQRVMAGLPFQMVFTRPTADGGRSWFDATGEPLTVAGAATGSVLVLRDITDRRLRRMQEEFLALTSHELRTPLTVMLMTTQLVERHLGTDEARLRPLLTVMLRQGQHLEQLIAELTDVTRVQSGKLHLTFAPVEVITLIAQTVTACQIRMPQPPIVVEASAPLTIWGDAVRMEQILINLLTNANTYAATSPQIVVRAQQVGDEVVIHVQDHGPGIDAAALPYLFQRSYQAHPEAKMAHHGLGLGLFITHALVVAQGGRITVTSQVGQGTTFTISFPLLPIPAPTTIA